MIAFLINLSLRLRWILSYEKESKLMELFNMEDNFVVYNFINFHAIDLRSFEATTLVLRLFVVYTTIK